MHFRALQFNSEISQPVFPIPHHICYAFQNSLLVTFMGNRERVLSNSPQKVGDIYSAVKEISDFLVLRCIFQLFFSREDPSRFPVPQI